MGVLAYALGHPAAIAAVEREKAAAEKKDLNLLTVVDDMAGDELGNVYVSSAMVRSFLFSHLSPACPIPRFCTRCLARICALTPPLRLPPCPAAACAAGPDRRS
jgi:hypothetical protein